MSATPLPNEPRTVAGSGGPPYDESMDRRLIVLETRFDVILPTLATKHDLELLRAEVKEDMNASIENLRHDTHASMENLRRDTNASIENLRHELIGEIDKRTGELTGQLDQLRQEMATMLKWVIALFISTMIALFGTTFTLINAIKTVPPARTASAVSQPSSSPTPAPLSR